MYDTCANGEQFWTLYTRDCLKDEWQYAGDNQETACCDLEDGDIEYVSCGNGTGQRARQRQLSSSQCEYTSNYTYLSELSTCSCHDSRYYYYNQNPEGGCGADENINNCAKRVRYHEYYQKPDRLAVGDQYCYASTTWVGYEDKGDCRPASYTWRVAGAPYDDGPSNGGKPLADTSCDEAGSGVCVKKKGSQYDFYNCNCVKAEDKTCSGTYQSWTSDPPTGLVD